ncbi:hypothetical protein ACH5RR_013227 [Cinchona calisaya]|uniref:Plastid-targeted protein 4 n=1 Tax=Cinchona calisaya TaxID=153742 RepID=A0ABD2ZZF3_9GENT
MSSKIIPSHSVCNLTFYDHDSINRYFCFPNSSNPCCLNQSKHSHNNSSKQTKINLFHLGAKYGVSKVMCSSGTGSVHQESDAPTPQKSDTSPWKKWTIGIVLSILLPSFGHKMGPLLLLKSKVDTAIEKVEEVTEIVDEVAEATEELAEMVEEKLPENSKIKKDVDILKNLSEKAVDKAKQAEKLVHQIEDVEDKLIDSLTEAANSAAKEETSNKDVDRPVKT